MALQSSWAKAQPQFPDCTLSVWGMLGIPFRHHVYTLGTMDTYIDTRTSTLHLR